MQAPLKTNRVFRGALDFEKICGENIADRGAGQMGLIMLDFQWNDMQNSYGYAELAKPMYDQKMWVGEGVFGLEAPTVRDVVAIAAEIVGTATGQKNLIPLLQKN